MNTFSSIVINFIHIILMFILKVIFSVTRPLRPLHYFFASLGLFDYCTYQCQDFGVFVVFIGKYYKYFLLNI